MDGNYLVLRARVHNEIHVQYISDQKIVYVWEYLYIYPFLLGFF